MSPRVRRFDKAPHFPVAGLRVRAGLFPRCSACNALLIGWICPNMRCPLKGSGS
jgi:hypothetical protein